MSPITSQGMLRRQLRQVFLFGLILASPSYTDQFHYHNILLGERAQGLGGAFCAVADDASGVYYNPAGIAFAVANDISGSANAFYTREVTYKNTIGKDPFVEKSSGSVAPFVGALGKLDQISPGLVWAFGIYQTDSELKDQDSKIGPIGSLARFHRTSNIRASTSRVGAVVAKRFSSHFSFGFGVNAIVIEELIQDYQDARVIVIGSESTGYVETLTQNLRQQLTAKGIEPVLGIQVALGGSLSLGLTVKSSFPMTQNLTTTSEQTVTYSNAQTGVVVDKDATGYRGALPHRAVVDLKNKDPLSLPMEIRSGFAWFASPSFLLTGDLIYHGPAKGKSEQYHRESVTNLALGSEYYMTPSYPLRFGLFTNKDARKKLKADKINQPDHIDYYGASLFLGMANPNSQISVGYTRQLGRGKAQKLGSNPVQDVEATSGTIGFSVSSSF